MTKDNSVWGLSLLNHSTTASYSIIMEEDYYEISSDSLFSSVDLSAIGNEDIKQEPSNSSLRENSTNFYDDIIMQPEMQALFYSIYATIFIFGILGNALVCYVVGRNKAMHTVQNYFITNLALADILLCVLGVPFTPLYTFSQEWLFGRMLCHLVPYAQGTSVYISTLTLTSIAIDRFFVIIYPFKPRMKLSTCVLIIVCIWVFALLATLPYGIFLKFQTKPGKTCAESWPSEAARQIFSGSTAIMQFVLPFIIILLCYVKVSIKLSDRVRSKPGAKNSKKEALERERKRRTNRMLIAMVAIFGFSWLPLNVVNLINDVFAYVDEWKYYNFVFFCAHAIAMSSTCYNVFLYTWMNETFRKEFKEVLPCFTSSQDSRILLRRIQSERTVNGNNDTVQESYLPTQQNSVKPQNQGQEGDALPTLETIQEKCSSAPTSTVNAAETHQKGEIEATYHKFTDEVEVYTSNHRVIGNDVGEQEKELRHADDADVADRSAPNTVKLECL